LRSISLESSAANKLTDVPIPGIHIIANFKVGDLSLLRWHDPFKAFIDTEIEKFSLKKVGEAYHNFDNGGYTGVICLTESHLSIHTWPEHHYLTFDVFLSNYLRDNRETTRALYEVVKRYFAADVILEQTIER
jgi:S-adenosylmethionine decarboxylase